MTTLELATAIDATIRRKTNDAHLGIEALAKVLCVHLATSKLPHTSDAEFKRDFLALFGADLERALAQVSAKRRAGLN